MKRKVLTKNELKKIAEDRRRDEKQKEELEAGKTAQLAEAVNKYGTESQRERWNENLMPRNEAVELLWQKTFEPLLAEGFELNKSTGYLLTTETDEYGEEIDMDETEKRTLNDEQWATVKKIKSVMPDATYEFYHQYYEEHSELGTIDLVRLTKVIGKITLQCDIILS